MTRRLTGLAMALSAALCVVLAAAPGANACTSCPTSFRDFVQHNDRIVLARYVGRSGGRFEYQVLDVLKGTRSPVTLRFPFDPSGTPAPPVGSRWLFSTFIAPDGLIAANAVFGVSANGRVTPDDVGEGRVEAPDTLAGWYAAIARTPDTSTADASEEAASDNGPRQPPVLPLIAVAVLGALATLRRLSSNRVAVDPSGRARDARQDTLLE